MGRKKKLYRIEVKTLPNGYSLDFEGARNNGFMYFSADDLLKGFMIHIGLKMTDQLNMETMDDFITTAINWKDNEKCIEEIERLRRELTSMTNKRNALAKRLVDERRDYLSIRAAIDNINKESKNPFGSEMVSNMAGNALHNHKPKGELSLKLLGVGADAIIPDDDDDEEDDE